MQSAYKTITRVMTGGKIEIISPQLPDHETVEVIILCQSVKPSAAFITKRSVMDILNETSRSRVFRTPEEVKEYLRKEHDAWVN